MSISELSVRVARAEIERDEALARARRAEEACQLFLGRDKENLLDTLQIIGIPARDLSDIYSIVNEWRRNGGCSSLLEIYRDRIEARKQTTGEWLDTLEARFRSEQTDDWGFPDKRTTREYAARQARMAVEELRYKIVEFDGAVTEAARSPREDDRV